MANLKNTKRALVSAVLALVMCFSTLVGTTFAWFTDSAASTNNVIQTGNLDIEMYWAEGQNAVPAAGDVAWKNVEGDNAEAIFNYDNWEPGYAVARHLKVVNTGSLAFKYKLVIQPLGDYSKLAEVIDVYYVETATQIADRAVIADEYKVGTLADMIEDPDGAAYGVLLPAGATPANANEVVGEKAITIVLKMQESAGNEYQNLSIGDGFSVYAFATQYMYEEDSLGNDYDDKTTYSYHAYNTVAVDRSATQQELDLMDQHSDLGVGEGGKIGFANIPTAALADDATEVAVNVVKIETNEGISFTSDQTGATYNVTVTGLKDNNDVPVKVGIEIGRNLTNVQLYHYTTALTEGVDYTYNSNTGYVIFSSADFSPFTVVFDKEIVEVEDTIPADPNALPVAIVTEKPEFVNVELPWGNYGQWSPTEGLDSTLEAAYEFSCEDTPEEASASIYADWYCDFYVKLDKDLAANQIFLGGNYGSFGWIGFHNGDLALDANTEIPLLGSVTANPWTYEEIATYVGTFTCGVGDVDNALSGATFTVMLRLTNPNNTNEYYDIKTINYKFQ